MAAWTGQALAQSGPLTKIIFPFAAGGGGDALCRLLAQHIGPLLDPAIYKVNLIPYNPTGFYDGSSRGAIAAFKAVLEEHGVRATVRLTRGRDIDAACGQLAATAAQA